MLTPANLSPPPAGPAQTLWGKAQNEGAMTCQNSRGRCALAFFSFPAPAAPVQAAKVHRPGFYLRVREMLCDFREPGRSPGEAGSTWRGSCQTHEIRFPLGDGQRVTDVFTWLLLNFDPLLQQGSRQKGQAPGPRAAHRLRARCQRPAPSELVRGVSAPAGWLWRMEMV